MATTTTTIPNGRGNTTTDNNGPGNNESPGITVLASSRAIVSGRLTAATITISLATGKITSVTTSVLPQSSFPPGTPYKDYSPQVLMPGLVDAHVHLNEPGRTEWEGFYTGTQAAAFGGVTTVVDMPLNSIPPTTTVDGLKAKVQAAEGQCWVDVGFYGGVIPGNASELKPLVKHGVRGFKGFLIDSGIEEFPAVTAKDIHKAMIELADEPTTLMFHAEMVPHENGAHGHHHEDGQAEPNDGDEERKPTSYSTFLASRPSTFETCAVEEILALSHVAPQLPLHIVHLSAMQVIPLLRKARVSGVNITAETCFHYLSLAAEDIGDGDTRHKCCPPIRERNNQDSLWQELLRHAAADGVIKTVVSDHSPCTPDLKMLPSSIPGSHHAASSSSSSQEALDRPTSSSSTTAELDDDDGDFLTAWGGISSVGLGLSILWTELSQRYQASSIAPSGIPFLEEIVQWCCVNTATQVGLATQKGTLAVGYDGDVCVFDPDAKWIVEPSTMLFRNKCSPFQGRTLKGAVAETWLGGRKVFSRKNGFAHGLPDGKLLLEPRTR